MIGAGDEPKVRKDLVSECCVRAGVPDYCLGLCTQALPMSRSVGKRMNACTKYDEDIEKCWFRSPLDIPEKIGKLVMQVFLFTGSCAFISYFTSH